jgi:hypothetical protein
MKRTALVLTALCLLIALSGTAPAQEQIRFATSNTGSTGHVYGAGIATIVNKYSDTVKLNAFTTSGVVENERLLRSGNAHMAMLGSGVVINVYNGTGIFEGKANPKLRTLWVGYPVHINLVVPAGSDIKTVSDLKGKRFGTGNAGSTAFLQIEHVLKLYGLDYSSVRTQPLSLSDKVSAMKDNNIDAMGDLQGSNTPALVDLAMNLPVRWLSVEDEKWQQLRDQFPKGMYIRTTIPANTYQGQTEDVHTVGSTNLWIATIDMPEEAAYEIVKQFWEHKTEADAIHPIIRESKPAIVEDELPVPLHPGARKYYVEKGMLK